MFKKFIVCISCILPITACSVNFLRGEFGYIDHHIALWDFIRGEWHFKKTGIDPYKKFELEPLNPSSESIFYYIQSIYPDDPRYSLNNEKDYLFEIKDDELLNNKEFLYTLLANPCKAKIMNNGNVSYSQPNGIGFPFGRMKSIIRCQKGYYKLEQISGNVFVIKY